jgi:uncharacterized membrane protein
LILLLAIVAVLAAVEALRRVGRIAEANQLLRRDIERLSNDFVTLKKTLQDATAPPGEHSKPVEAAPTSNGNAVQDTAAAEGLEETVETKGPDIETELMEDAEPEPAKAAVSSANWNASNTSEIVSDVARDPKPATRHKSALQDIEQLLAGRWFVVLGGVAIALAGLLFVKYANDNGLIPPWLRIVIGYGFSGALVAGGEYIRRKRNPVIADHVPAALSAAGIVTAFGVTYAAYALYDIFSPGVCFPLLVAIGLGAIWLSRLQGPLIAALGLIGSYLAPALVPSEHPSAWGFFAYLLVIAIACFYELRNRPWWWLGFSAVAGALAWSMLWIAGSFFNPADTVPAGCFAFALAFAAAFIPRGTAILEAEALSKTKMPEPPQQVMIVASAAASLILAALVFATHHGTTALSFFATGMAVLAAFGWFKRHSNIAAPLAALTSFVVLMAWPDVATLYPAFDDRGFWTLVPGLVEPPRFVRWMIAAGIGFTLLGLLGTLRKAQPPFWDALAAASAVSFLFGAWAQGDFVTSSVTWIMLALAGATLLGGVVYRLKERMADSLVATSIAYFAIATAALMLFAADRIFDEVWYTLAIAALALAAACTTCIINHRIFGLIAAFLASLASLKLFLAREFWALPTLPLGEHWPIYGYGLPAVAFWLAARSLPQTRDERPRISLEGLSLGLLISLASLELRVLIGGGVTADRFSLLELSSHAVTWLAAAFGLAYRQKIYSGFVSRWGVLALTCAASAILLIMLLPMNPAITGDTLAGNVIVNTLWLAYALPALLIAVLVNRKTSLSVTPYREVLGGLAFAAVMMFATLMVKRFYQGPVLDPRFLSDAENYSVSLMWLAIGIIAFVGGLKTERQYIRVAALVILALTVLKVFIYDFAELSGLWRIASLLGLGLCLVGIGWLYSRFVHKGSPPPTEVAGPKA